MKVRDLVILLQKCDQDAQVLVWHAYNDCASSDVHVSVARYGDVHIGITAFGTEVMPDKFAGPNV